MRQKPLSHWWRRLNLSKRLPRFFWALVCVSWGLVMHGEFGMAQQRDFAVWLQELRAGSPDARDSPADAQYRAFRAAAADARARTRPQTA